MEQLFDLLKYIYAIRFYSKDIHYNAKGESFWSDHLFADEVFNGIDDFIDQINENLYLGYENKAPRSKDILEAVVGSIPPLPTDITQCWKNLSNLIVNAIQLINDIENEYSDAPISSLLDSIADDLQKKRGLIWRRKLSI